MKKLTVLLVVAGTLSMLAGCKEDKPATPAEVVQTVDWYKAHKTERAEVLAKCKANPGELAATPNCVNASRADSSSTWSAKGGGVSPAIRAASGTGPSPASSITFRPASGPFLPVAAPPVDEPAIPAYFGAMRMAPSRRMVSPFSIWFSTM